jgi:hypothetical protein
MPTPTKRNRRIPESLEAGIKAALVLGDPPCEVAESYKVSLSTVYKYGKRLPAGVMDNARYERVGDLVYTYLTEGLKTLETQCRQFRDPEWLKAQSADSVARLHGILADKIIRILSAIERAQSSSRGAEADPN